KSQVLAILLSKVGILLIAALLFRSFVAGLYTVLPVTLTTLLVGGASGWLGIPLDVSTVLAAGVAIGVGVDYTVHYLFRYAYEHRRGLDEYQATLAAMRSVGKPIVFNATVVTAGFLVLGLSQFPPHVKLGYFVSSYMVIACLAALVLLPLAFAYYRPQFSRTARLQHEPA
ncbi:MAG: MMPL family transporter, partial [Gammaproteobacteria bacterium]